MQKSRLMGEMKRYAWDETFSATADSRITRTICILGYWDERPILSFVNATIEAQRVDGWQLVESSIEKYRAPTGRGYANATLVFEQVVDA